MTKTTLQNIAKLIVALKLIEIQKKQKVLVK